VSLAPSDLSFFFFFFSKHGLELSFERFVLRELKGNMENIYIVFSAFKIEAELTLPFHI
jgi:hypothetical protein